jgi:hypothetical protein
MNDHFFHFSGYNTTSVKWHTVPRKKSAPLKIKVIKKKRERRRVPDVHACKPSFPGGRVQDDRSPKGR